MSSSPSLPDNMDQEMRAFVESLDERMTSEDIATLEACMECRNCGQACNWYLTTDDEDLHPQHKLEFIRQVYRRYLTIEGKLGSKLNIHETPTSEDLRENMEYYWKCTACGRCTLSCPQGLSVRRIVRIARKAFVDAGLAQENDTIDSIIENTEEYRHSFGLTREQVLGRIGLFLYAQELEVPVEVEDPEYLFVCPTAGNTKLPDFGTKLIQMLNAAGIDYSVTPRVVDTGTEIDHVSTHEGLTRELLLEWEQEAERLGADKVLVMECGCDTRTMNAEADDTLGRPFKFPFVSIDTVLLDAIENGDLPVEPVDDRITMHDPCYVTRLSGRGEMERDLLNAVTTNFVEMQPNGEENYCCNAGAGPMRIPEYEDLRLQASELKANQIADTGADRVVTPCAICNLSLTQTTEEYDLANEDERMVRMMYEIVYEAVAAGLRKRGEMNRVTLPAALQDVDETYFHEHSVQGFLTDLVTQEKFDTVRNWLRRDDIVDRFKQNNPEVAHRVDEILEADPAAIEPQPGRPGELAWT